MTTYDGDASGTARPMGRILTTGRGSMPFALLDGEPLVTHAAEALAEAGVDIVDFTVRLVDVRDQGRTLVVHDPLCPLTPADFLRETVRTAEDEGVVVVGVHPVTDTIKRVRAGVVGETVDREELWSLASPVVLPAPVVEQLDRWPADDLGATVTWLRERFEVRFVEAPVVARRVDDESSIVLLEALAG